MNDLQVFNNADFGSVRTLEIDGKRISGTYLAGGD